MPKEAATTDLETLQKNLRYMFKDNRLLKQALTHPSFAYESKDRNVSDNKRLEFLGDSILGAVVSLYLYEENPASNEGELTRLRALLVNKNALSKQAQRLRLQDYLLLGRGEGKIGGRHNATNLAGSLEAVIAAVYLDGGFDEVKEFILQTIIEK